MKILIYKQLRISKKKHPHVLNATSLSKHGKTLAYLDHKLHFVVDWVPVYKSYS